MAQEFDPYHTWLGIPPSERPADHYRLLGVPRLEQDPDVISNAADARMAFIRTFQGGPKAAFSQQILNELAVARTTLLTEQRKSAYDQQLCEAVAAEARGSAVLPVATALPQERAPAPAVAVAAVAEPLPWLAASPAASLRKPQRKRRPRTLPLLIAGFAVPIVLLGLVVGYVLTKGGKTDQVAQNPTTPPELPVPTQGTDPKTADPESTDPESPDPESPEPEKTDPEKTGPVTPATPANDPPRGTPQVERPEDKAPKGKNPAAPDNQVTAQSIDLLAMVETPRDVPQGEVVRGSEGLTMRRRGGFACAVVPFDFPASYELNLRVTPRGGEGLLIGLPIGGRRCMLTIDGFGNEPPDMKTRTALETIDGRRPHEPEYPGEPHVGKLLRPGVESQLSIRVSGDTLMLTCDGKPVLDWSGNPARLGIYGLFDHGSRRRMFVGAWAAEYEVSSLTLKPLDTPLASATSVPPVDRKPSVTADNRPWRWARVRSDAQALAMTPDGKRAFAFQPGRRPLRIYSLDLSTGDYADRLDGPGVVENAQTFAAGPEPASLLAFSIADNNSLSTFVRSLSGNVGLERQFPNQPPDMRYAFSADGKYLAASSGRVSGSINLLNVETGLAVGRIEPPAKMRGAFVDRMLNDDGLLLVLYTLPKNANAIENRAVAYDWKTRRSKKTRDFPTKGGTVRGLRFEDDRLWVWGRDNDHAIVLVYPKAGAVKPHVRIPGNQSVSDVHIPSETALLIDSAAPQLIVSNWASDGKQAEVQYSAPVADARFVEEGKAIFSQPSRSTDLTLLWETGPLLDARRVAAPTAQQIGLNDFQRQTAVKAVLRSEVKLRSTSSSRGTQDTPDRETAKKELAEVNVSIPSGEVKFLNIHSDRFTEEHVELLLAFPELEGLSLHNIQPTTKMFERLAELPTLRTLQFANSPVTDEHLAGLANATQLQGLHLHGTKVAGDGLQHLVDLPLQHFGIAPESPNLAGWQAIGKFKSLQSCGNLGPQQADEKLAAISELPNLRQLNLGNDRLSGAGLKAIAGLTSLVHLDLPQTGLSDEDLRPLESLTKLQFLSLPNSTGDGAIEFFPDTDLQYLTVRGEVTDAGLLAIAKKYPGLQVCNLLHCSKVTEKGLGHLADHTRLQMLVLPSSPSVPMFKQIARMPELRRIEQNFGSLSAAHLAPLRGHPTLADFQLVQIGDEALAELSKVPALKNLSINQPLCRAKGLEHLAKASNLENLNLMHGEAVKDYGDDEVAALQKLTQLKHLNVFGAPLDQASIDKIKQALPKTNVQIMR